MKTQRGYTIAELLVVVGFLVAISIFGLGIYVIAHFVIKFW